MLVTQHPYIDEYGVEHEDLVKTYSDVGNEIMQNETMTVYSEAVDRYPSPYTYTEIIPQVPEA